MLVYYEVYSDPLMIAGAGTLIHEIIMLAGGRNIFADVAEKYPKLSAEVVVERQPQVILFPDYHGSAEIIVEQMTSGRAGRVFRLCGRTVHLPSTMTLFPVRAPGGDPPLTI